MTPLAIAHKELSEELEGFILLMQDEDFDNLPDYMSERIIKERNRLEMLLEVLEEDDEFIE
jgi:hypothetical protein|tara:strand:+ start:997 stop:1179 length:183 start_codon:yes stop_codon:yes gene_type:complete